LSNEAYPTPVTALSIESSVHSLVTANALLLTVHPLPSVSDSLDSLIVLKYLSMIGKFEARNPKLETISMIRKKDSKVPNEIGSDFVFGINHFDFEIVSDFDI